MRRGHCGGGPASRSSERCRRGMRGLRAPHPRCGATATAAAGRCSGTPCTEKAARVGAGNGADPRPRTGDGGSRRRLFALPCAESDCRQLPTRVITASAGRGSTLRGGRPHLELRCAQQLPRAARERATDRRRRRDGRDPRRSRPGAALPRGGERPRPGERRGRARGVHRRRRRADRDEHLRSDPAASSPASFSRDSSKRSSRRAFGSRERLETSRGERSSSPARSGRRGKPRRSTVGSRPCCTRRRPACSKVEASISSASRRSSIWRSWRRPWRRCRRRPRCPSLQRSRSTRTARRSEGSPPLRRPHDSRRSASQPSGRTTASGRAPRSSR